MEKRSKLQFLPITLFSTVMGLAGLTLALRAAETHLGFTAQFDGIAAGITGSIFIVLIIFYTLKVLRYPSDVKKELKHPIKLSFFPAFSISLILCAMILLPYHQQGALILWSAGAAIQLVFTLYVMSQWLLSGHFHIGHISPPWFIPVVGNILVPVAGSKLVSIEISWFYFSIGLLYWLILLTLIFQRKIGHSQLPLKLFPTLFILIAPPAVGFLSYVNMTGQMDGFARFLYFSAVFVAILLVVNLHRFLRLPFFISWWAYSFPVAALTIATAVMFEMTGWRGYWWAAYGLLLILVVIIAILVIRTLSALLTGQLLIPEEE